MHSATTIKKRCKEYSETSTLCTPPAAFAAAAALRLLAAWYRFSPHPTPESSHRPRYNRCRSSRSHPHPSSCSRCTVPPLPFPPLPNPYSCRQRRYCCPWPRARRTRGKDKIGAFQCSNQGWGELVCSRNDVSMFQKGAQHVVPPECARQEDPDNVNDESDFPTATASNTKARWR